MAVEVVGDEHRLVTASADDNVREGVLTVTYVHHDETPPRTVTETYRYDPDTAMPIAAETK